MGDSEVKRLDETDIESEEWFDAPEEHFQTETSMLQSYVTILKEEDIRRRMKHEIQSVSDIYSISEAEATLLLPHFRRDASEFLKKWFDDATSVRESVGLLERSLDSHSDDKEFFCGVCYALHSLEKSASVSCGHRVCIYCWKRHINNNINEIPAAWYWTLKCPYDCCPASVGRDIIERFALEEEKTKYDRYLFRSYVDGSKMMKCSPSPGRMQLEFIAEAWSQIMECRRVLKWTYAYEYYLRDEEIEKQAFLKHKQDDAEIPLAKLYYYAQNKLNTFLDAEGPSDDFTKFSFKLTTLTSITRNHYEHLVRDLEDGLSDVVPASRSQMAHSEDANGSDRNDDD